LRVASAAGSKFPAYYFITTMNCFRDPFAMLTPHPFAYCDPPF